MNLVSGTPQRLENYRGDVILIVNVASKCGMTPQYKDLQALFEAKKDQGLTILAFPANNFMNQEPGSNEDIAAFCEREYGVTFPVFEKISVKGEDIHPLYAMLTAQPEPVGGEIKWNFDKFLVNREGKVVARFGPRTKPSDAEFARTVDRLLAEPHD
ncbi:MAG: glutathione peroxidase [Phycisphaerales bacterium]|nr:glutathione peroxidase [Phycisphaerales bacterium]